MNFPLPDIQLCHHFPVVGFFPGFNKAAAGVQLPCHLVVFVVGQTDYKGSYTGIHYYPFDTKLQKLPAVALSLTVFVYHKPADIKLVFL